jgi:hypothetical protein
LAHSSKVILRNRFLGEKYKKNMEHLRKYLEKRHKIISSIFLFEAFTPLPSDQFFVAYGLTGLKLRYALIPFFIGRIFTYSLWVYIASEVSKYLAISPITSLSFFSLGFVLLELLIIGFIYLFVKIDWKHFISHKKLKILH